MGEAVTISDDVPDTQELLASLQHLEDYITRQKQRNDDIEEIKAERDEYMNNATKAEEARDELIEALEDSREVLKRFKTFLIEAGLQVPFDIIHCIDRADIALREASHG